MSQLIVNWSLTTVSYPLLLVLVMLAVKDDEEKIDEGNVKEEPTKPATLTSTGPV